MYQFKIFSEPSSFEPVKLLWVIHRRYRYLRFIPGTWEYVAAYKTKEEAIATVECLIQSGGPVYMQEK